MLLASKDDATLNNIKVDLASEEISESIMLEESRASIDKPFLLHKPLKKLNYYFLYLWYAQKDQIVEELETNHNHKQPV